MVKYNKLTLSVNRYCDYFSAPNIFIAGFLVNVFNNH